MESYKDEDFAAQAKSILERYPREQRFALAMMQDFQRKYDYLSQEAIRQIAAYLQIPSGKIYSLATFYKAFSLEKKGKYIIKVCDGTACHVRSSMQILEEIEAAGNYAGRHHRRRQVFPGDGQVPGDMRPGPGNGD